MRNRLGSLIALMVAAQVTVARADLATDNAALRIQVAKLQAQLDHAQKSCPAAGVTPPPEVPAMAHFAAPDAPAVAAAPPAPAVPTAAASPTVTFSPATAAAVSKPAPMPSPPVPPAAPPGYALVKIEPPKPPLVHDDRWKDDRAWKQLQTDMTPAKVESLLGVEHSSNTKGDRMSWGYGLLAGQAIGRVLFVDGKVTVWRAPDE